MGERLAVAGKVGGESSDDDYDPVDASNRPDPLRWSSRRSTRMRVLSRQAAEYIETFARAIAEDWGMAPRREGR